jgi:hypothetical protein
VSYYHNNLTNAITFTRSVVAPEKEEITATEDRTPSASNEKDQQHSSNHDIDNEESDTLPEGWAELVDNSTGQVYYYNSLTDEASWERPIANVNPICGAGDEDLQNNKPESEGSQEIIEKEEVVPEQTDPSIKGLTEPEEVVEEAEAESANLSDDWVESTDPASGNKYYFNIVTEEVSWEIPESRSKSSETNEESDAVSQENVEPEAEITDDAIGNDDEINVAQPEDLPDGWEKVEDSSSGQIYYYNADSGETNWERPTVEKDERVEESVEDDGNFDADAKNEAEDTDDSKSKDALPLGWEELEDASTGEIYYYNAESGETSWESPTAEVGDAAGEGTDVIPDNGEESEGVDEDEGIDNDGIEHLPDGWKEVEDPSTGEIYFYNAESGETSWERPAVEKVEDPTNGDVEILPDNVDQTESSVDGIDEGEGDNFKGADDLPDGWKEVEDSSSGQIYFYHAESGETSWDRPMAIGTDEGSQVNEETSENDAIDENRYKEDDDEKGEGKTDDLADGWEESEDPSSGEIYYYHAESGETSWEKPTLERIDDVQANHGDEDSKVEFATGESTEEHSDKNDHVNNDDDDANASGALPEGWEEVEDPSTGVIYYYNAESGDTSWERPKLDDMGVDSPDLPLDENDDKQTENEPEAQGDEDGPEVTNESAHNPLPEGWVESEDPTSGEVYYYHSESGEVSWERPTNGVAGTFGHEASEEISFETKPIDEDDEKLPEGWIESKDSSSGEVYYYHAESGETSWERPSSTEEMKRSLELSMVEEEDNETDELDDAKDSEEIENLSAPDPLPEFWVESEDPSSGKTFYYNSLTQEVSWKRPTADESSEAPESKVTGKLEDEFEHISGEDEIKESESTGSPELPLPEGWIESTDPTSGETYYYNVETEETSWERPVGSSLPFEENEPEIETNEEQTGDGAVDLPDASYAEQSEIANGEDEPADSEISSSWIKVENDSGDKPYYYNPKTGDTSWEKPDDVEIDETQAEEADDPNQEQIEGDLNDNGDLLDGWVEVVDPTSGDCYWYNHETQETTWEKPSKPVDVVNEVAYEGDEIDSDGKEVAVNVDDNIRDDWVDVDVQDPIPEDETDYSRDGDDEVDQQTLDLPDGWVESVDPSSGETFYWNENTNKTSWERPTENEPSTSSVDVAPALQNTTSQGPQSMPMNELGNISSIESEREKFGVSGPFTLCDDAVVTEYIMSKAQSEDILWQLIAIAVKAKGRLRSDYGVVDRSGPEAAIVKLLLSSPDYVNHKMKSTNDIVIEEKSKFQEFFGVSQN